MSPCQQHLRTPRMQWGGTRRLLRRLTKLTEPQLPKPSSVIDTIHRLRPGRSRREESFGRAEREDERRWEEQGRVAMSRLRRRSIWWNAAYSKALSYAWTIRAATAGKAKAGMDHPDCGWTRECAGKTVASLENTRHTWALLGWCFTKMRYIKYTYLYLYFPPNPS